MALHCRRSDLRCGEENHRYFGCNGTFTWCQCNIEKDMSKKRQRASDESDIIVDKTRIAVLTDEGWVEGVVEYAQVIKGKGGKRHTAYHVNVEFPEGPMHVTIGLDGSPPLCEMEWWIVGQEEQSADEELQDGALMAEERSTSQESNRMNESPLEGHVPPMPALPSDDCESSDPCEDYPPFDSRTGSPLPPCSDGSMDELNPTNQRECQVPYADIYLHPHAVHEGGRHSPTPPMASQDSDSDSSISEVEWETIHRPLEHVVDSMIADGEDLISAVNAFSSLITNTMRDTLSEDVHTVGTEAPHSAKKRPVPRAHPTARTRCAANAARKRLCHPTAQETGPKRKLPHAASATRKRPVLTQEATDVAVTRSASKRKSASAASAAQKRMATASPVPKRKPASAAGAAQKRSATASSAQKRKTIRAAGAARTRAPEPAHAKAIVQAYSKRSKRKSIAPGKAPKDAPPPKRHSRLRARALNSHLESLCQSVSVIIRPSDLIDHSGAPSPAPPLPSPPAGDDDQGSKEQQKTRKRTRKELDELALATRRKKQQRLDFGQHFKRPP